MKEAFYISRQHQDATSTDVAKTLYGFGATMHNRQLIGALDGMHNVRSNFSEKAKEFNDGWDYWGADTFLMIMFSNWKLLEQVEKIEFSTRNGEMTVYYKDNVVEEFRKDGYSESGIHLSYIDHDGERFDPLLVDDRRVVFKILLDMYYRAIHRLPDSRRK